MQSWESFRKELLKDKEFAKEYRSLEPRYRLISQIIGIRLKKGLTQKELAKKLATKQSAIARLESGDYNPSLKFLQRTAKALGARLVINFAQ